MAPSPTPPKRSTTKAARVFSLAAWASGLSRRSELQPLLKILLETKGVSAFARAACVDALRWIELGAPRRAFLMLPGMNHLRTGILLQPGDTITLHGNRSQAETQPGVVSAEERAAAYLTQGGSLMSITHENGTRLGRRRHLLGINRSGATLEWADFMDPVSEPAVAGFTHVVLEAPMVKK